MQAPGYYKKALHECDAEWSQHARTRVLVAFPQLTRTNGSAHFYAFLKHTKLKRMHFKYFILYTFQKEYALEYKTHSIVKYVLC